MIFFQAFWKKCLTSPTPVCFEVNLWGHFRVKDQSFVTAELQWKCLFVDDFPICKGASLIYQAPQSCSFISSSQFNSPALVFSLCLQLRDYLHKQNIYKVSSIMISFKLNLGSQPCRAERASPMARSHVWGGGGNTWRYGIKNNRTSTHFTGSVWERGFMRSHNISLHTTVN